MEAISECKKRAHSQRKLRQQTLNEVASHLEAVLPQKYTILISTAGEKGVSSWLTNDPLTSNGTILNKSDFWDAISLRYGYELEGIPDKCVCGAEMTPDHALSCPCGGYPSARHNEIRDVLAEVMRSVVHDVELEPTLLPYEGEDLDGRGPNRSQAACVDIRAHGFWTRQQDAFFDVRVTNPKANLHTVSEVRQQLLDHEKQKKRQYLQRVVNIDRGSFTPLVFGTNGMVGKECDRALKAMVGMIVSKHTDLNYSTVMSLLRTKLRFAILRWNITCFRGCRASYLRRKVGHFVSECHLVG